MYKSDVLDHFKTTMKLAKFLKIHQSAVSQWGDVIPEKQALKLERMTKGALKYRPALYNTQEQAS